MYKDLLKEVVGSIAGDKAKVIVDTLYEKKNVNEFLISKKFHLMINQTRNLLYKLAEAGIVSFIRKKDSKKGGWYTYFWTFHIGKGLAKYKEHLLKSMENVKNQIHLKKTERHYSCANCQIEMNEEQALVHNYTCLECGEILNFKDNLKEIQNLERDLAKSEKILSDIDKAILDISGKDEKTRQRKIKADEKKKKKERKKNKLKKSRENKIIKKSIRSKLRKKSKRKSKLKKRKMQSRLKKSKRKRR